MIPLQTERLLIPKVILASPRPTFAGTVHLSLTLEDSLPCHPFPCRQLSSSFLLSLLLAWRARCFRFCSVKSMTTKSAYLFPHCEARVYPLFSSLFWSWTWHQLFFFYLEHPVIDLPWKASLGYDLSMTCGWMLDIRQTVFHLFNLHEVVNVVHN